MLFRDVRILAGRAAADRAEYRDRDQARPVVHDQLGAEPFEDLCVPI
jgi:hypothetical protein